MPSVVGTFLTTEGTGAHRETTRALLCPLELHFTGRTFALCHRRKGRRPKLQNYQSTHQFSLQLTSPSFRGKLPLEPAFHRIIHAGGRNKICSRTLCRGPSSALTIRILTSPASS